MHNTPITPEWPEPLVSAEIPTLDYVVEVVGPQAVAEALRMPVETPVEELTSRIMTIEGGTYAGYLSEFGHTHFFLNRVGRHALTDAMKLPGNISDDGIRTSIRELHRRSEAAKLGLPADATMEDISATKGAQELQATIAELDLPESATWADALRARECDRLGLPRNCSEETLAESMRSEMESVQPPAQTHSVEIIRQVRDPVESDESWQKRTMYES